MPPWPTVFAVALLTAGPDGIDSDMFRDPPLPVARVVTTFPDGLLPLWLQALDWPEADLQSRAALAVAAAHEQGLAGMREAVPSLLRLLDRLDLHPAPRAAAVRAVVALDAREAAPALLRLAQLGDPDVSELAEPALGRWGYRPAAAVWLDRLDRPPLRRPAVLAIDGLAAVGEERAVPRLRELALAADAAPPYRLAAARALAVLRPAGGEPDASGLATASAPMNVTARLVAATLLRHHQGDVAVGLLQAFARDPEPAVATAALSRLAELGPDHVLPVLDAVLASPDGPVRVFGVEAMIRRPSAVHVGRLGDHLADPHPAVRAKARHGLREQAGTTDLRALVLGRATAALAATDWRSQEQAALLLGQLGHAPAAGRLVELLPSGRAEVAVAAAWGLRVLAVPGTLAPALAHVERRHRELLAAGRTAGLTTIPPGELDRQLSQLVQFLGRAGYRPAEPALRKLVPRRAGEGGMSPPPTPVGGETRAAAVWALGRRYAGGGGPADLVQEIERRLAEVPADGPDDERVRRMAAVALGRMKATEFLPSIRFVAGEPGPTTDPLVVACRWAVAELTGQLPPAAGVVERVDRNWFLSPVRGDR